MGQLCSTGEEAVTVEGTTATKEQKGEGQESSKKMKAIISKDYVADVVADLDLTPVEIDIPKASKGMVVIKNKAASINPIDAMVLQGAVKDAGWPVAFPFTPGYDIAGVVSEVGEDVSDFAVGDEVFACNWGSNKETHLNNHADEGLPVAGAFAEYTLIPASKVSKKPAGITFEEAAAVALVGQTAMQSVERGCGAGDEIKDKKVLILGGAGAVGYIACQLAKLGGATVYTTCSPRTMEYVKGTGADHFINYREVDWSTSEETKDMDAVLDLVGEEKGFEKAKGILKEGGSYVAIATYDAGFDPSGHPPLKFASFMVLRNDTAHQDKLAELVASKKLKLNVEKTFPFTKEGVTDAFTAQKSGKSMGKNVIVF